MRQVQNIDNIHQIRPKYRKQTLETSKTKQTIDIRYVQQQTIDIRYVQNIDNRHLISSKKIDNRHLLRPKYRQQTIDASKMQTKDIRYVQKITIENRYVQNTDNRQQMRPKNRQLTLDSCKKQTLDIRFVQNVDNTHQIRPNIKGASNQT